MLPCTLCHGLQKNERTSRFFIEFTPNELSESVATLKCKTCALLLDGIKRMQTDKWSFEADVSRVYGRVSLESASTLVLEVYFIEERPRLTLEFYSIQNSHHRSIELDFSLLTTTDIVKIPGINIQKTEINGHPISLESKRWVDYHIRNCLQQHSSCNSELGVSLDSFLPGDNCLGQLATIVKTPLPNRILYLEHSSDAPTVKLLEPIGVSGAYAALSYCWGLYLSCQLTRDNLDDRKIRIPWPELPTTFQDAVQYCLFLGISYLWIDALCILQDDQNDWHLEASQMDEIYQNFVITLAATSSKSNNAGMFPKLASTRSHLVSDSLQIDNLRCEIRVREQLSHWNLAENSYFGENYPLLTRGWAFQERLLSPRVLHFSKQELVWERKKLTSCECGGISNNNHLIRPLLFQGVSRFEERYGILREAFKILFQELFERTRFLSDVTMGKIENWLRRVDQHRKALGFATEAFESWCRRVIRRIIHLCPGATQPRISGLEHEPDGYDDMINIPDIHKALTYWHHRMMGSCLRSSLLKQSVKEWHDIVEQYSGLCLTKDLDRLPALSGLAKRIKPLFASEYCAGLWRVSLVEDLAWRVDKLIPGLNHRGVYRGPSWSWVSANGQVKYWNQEELCSRFHWPSQIQLGYVTWINEILQYYGFRRPSDRHRQLRQTPGAQNRGRERRYCNSDLIDETSSSDDYMVRTRRRSGAQGRGQRNLGKPAPKILQLTIKRGKNNYGRVFSSLLVMEGMACSARICPDVLVPSEFELLLSLPKQGSLRLPFSPDYVLAENASIGPDATLFLLSDEICLVLVKTKMQTKEIEIYRRIGITRRPSQIETMYRIDWMECARLATVGII